MCMKCKATSTLLRNDRKVHANGHTDGRTDGRYQVHYLPRFAVDKYERICCKFNRVI